MGTRWGVRSRPRILAVAPGPPTDPETFSGASASLLRELSARDALVAAVDGRPSALTRLEQAASTLGAAPWQVFATVTLPLALPGVLAGMVLGFAKAIGEFGATITFVSNIPGETQTISSAIYSLIQTPDGDSAAGRLVIVSTVIAMGALIASEWFARRATKRLHGN